MKFRPTKCVIYKDNIYLNMPKLIVVCGFTASGKTTLANELSKRLNIVCLHKDSIKEQLYDHRQLSTLDHSKDLGAEAIKLLLSLAEEQLAHDTDVIIEAPFTYLEDYSIFREWINNYNAKFFAIICSIPDAERQRRFEQRDRHPAHHDDERIFKTQLDIYDQLPDKKIRITTDKDTSTLVTELIDWLGK